MDYEVSLTDEYVNQTLVDKAKEIADIQVPLNKMIRNPEDLIEMAREWNIVFSCSLKAFNIGVGSEQMYEEEDGDYE
jgi:hypothetical protein